nr:hypothetical protein [Actinomycetota bacterium]
MNASSLPRFRRRIAVGLAVVLFGVLQGTVPPVTAEPNEAGAPTTQDAQRRITGGGLHTCAVLDTGEVQCWGQNDNGQLGTDSVAATTVPKKVVGITTALGVSGGATHTCALIHDGTVECWGNNGSGQLGNGRTSPPDPPVLVPVTVSNLSDATAVAAGGFHTCALRAGGTVVCWGHDGSGQLGDGGTLGTSYVPVTVQVDTNADPAVETLGPLTGATAVASGEYHSCAIVGATGEVKCWGHNGFGQLGNGASLPGTHSSIAVTVSGIPDDDPHAHPPHKAVAIAAGESHTCAVLDDNSARCWGHNFFGQLGNNASGDGTDSSTPVKVKMDDDGDPLLTPGDVEDVSGVLAVAAGQFHTCVLRTDGGGRCWGQNGRGQLGDGTTTDRKIAFPVAGLAGATALTAGGFHNCALVGTAMKCWGYNFHGQLGAYEPSNRTPVTVTALSAATTVTVGDGHACGLVTSTAVPPTDQPVCWGNNASGELGADLTPSPANTTIPVDVAGISDAGAVGLDAPELVDPISAGNQFSCALPAGSSTPKCWGRGVNGELGNGANASSDVPVAVSGLTGVTQVSAGGELDPVSGQETAHACARRSDGTVRCWGSNSCGYFDEIVSCAGQLGHGGANVGDDETPAAVSPLT